MKKMGGACGLVLLMISFTLGCASILSKSECPVSISSKPEGTDIRIVNKSNNAVFSGKTPAIVVLKAGAGFFQGEDYTVTFTKEGYAPFDAQIKRGVNGWYIGNILFGGLIGLLIVDPATGAMWTLENLHVDLSPQASSSTRNSFQIVSIDEVPPDLRSRMVEITPSKRTKQ